MRKYWQSFASGVLGSSMQLRRVKLDGHRISLMITSVAEADKIEIPEFSTLSLSHRAQSKGIYEYQIILIS